MAHAVRSQFRKEGQHIDVRIFTFKRKFFFLDHQLRTTSTLNGAQCGYKKCESSLLWYGRSASSHHMYCIYLYNNICLDAICDNTIMRIMLAINRFAQSVVILMTQISTPFCLANAPHTHTNEMHALF